MGAWVLILALVGSILLFSGGWGAAIIGAIILGSLIIVGRK